jgi:hypothetical protein
MKYLCIMQSRSRFLWLAALLVLGSSTAARAAEFGAPNSLRPKPLADESESARDLEVGTRLVATTDVKLRDVTLSKGAKVTVRKLEVKQGRVASVDVELADGQVLRHIDAATIRRSFTVAAD